MSTTHYPKPSADAYRAAADAIERRIASWPEPETPYEFVVIEGQRLRARAFRALAEKGEH